MRRQDVFGPDRRSLAPPALWSPLVAKTAKDGSADEGQTKVHRMRLKRRAAESPKVLGSRNGPLPRFEAYRCRACHRRLMGKYHGLRRTPFEEKFHANMSATIDQQNRRSGLGGAALISKSRRPRADGRRSFRDVDRKMVGSAYGP